MAEDFRCNVLIMGKTGTGKSTLLNYLCDSRIAATGAGKPVTGEGIYEYSVLINGQEVRVFDSWGIEAGKVERWKALLDRSLKEHGVQKRMEDWFHSVIYCIQAGGGRVEDIDIEIIRRFLLDGYLLTVVLTKADQFKKNPDAERQMRNVLLDELTSSIPASGKGRINILSTCAERKKLYDGEVTVPFGKEEVQKAILEGWKETVIERLPKHVVARLCEIVDDWKEEEIQKISLKKVSGLHESNLDLYDEVYQDATAFAGDVKAETKRILDEAVQSTRKAGTSLSVMLDLDLETMPKQKDSPVKWWEILLGIPVVIVTAIPSFLRGLIRKFSPSSQKNERQQLVAYVEYCANRFSSKCQKLESKIAKELNKTL